VVVVGGNPDDDDVCHSFAMKIRSDNGFLGGYNTAGKNSNCPVRLFSCGKYKAMDFILLLVVVPLLLFSLALALPLLLVLLLLVWGMWNDDDDEERCTTTNEKVNNSICAMAKS
jgi:choline-glycine betaine transporter